MEQIRFVFDNDEITDWIQNNVVDEILLKDIHLEYRKNKNGQYDDELIANGVSILLNKSADKTMEFLTPMTLFERLRLSNDITGIDVLYTDGEQAMVYVPWERNYGENLLQSVEQLGDSVMVKIEREYEGN